MPDKKIAYMGIDLHQKSVTIAVLVDYENNIKEVVSLENDFKKLDRFFKRYNPSHEIQACYEASGSGYGLCRWMREQGYSCEVIAPSLIPRKPGERRKTDSRDAKQLALLYRSGHLSCISVPSVREEQDRSLLRARHFMKRQEVRLKQVIMKYLQVSGYRYPKKTLWNREYIQWVKALEMESTPRYVLDLYLSEFDVARQTLQQLDQKIEQLSQSEGYSQRVQYLKSFRGVQTLTAMTLLTEIGDFKRFGQAQKLMSFLGLVPGEDSSGERQRHTRITKMGNHECRRVLVEAAQHAKSRPLVSRALAERQQGQPSQVIAISRKAMKRLHSQYWKIFIKKGANKAKVAVAREMSGFIWSMMKQVA